MTSAQSTDTRRAEARTPLPSAVAGSSIPGRFGWLRSKRIAVVAAAAFAVAAIAFGSAWFGFAAILPLLYFLPCAAMVYFCSKGMNNPGEGTAAKHHDEE